MRYPLNELLLKLTLIDRKVLVSLPHIVIILFNDIRIDKTHLDKRLDAILQQVPVDLLSISVLCDLVQESCSQTVLESSEALLLEELERTHGEGLHIGILQVVPVLKRE
jgi:hypothetical protein